MIVPINTEVGELHGRDAIYLDNEIYDEKQNELLVAGDLNGKLCSEEVIGDFIPYEIKFTGVSAYKKIELDEWLELGKPLFHETSSFYSVTDNGKTIYVYQTYDWVFEIHCKNYEFKLFKNT